MEKGSGLQVERRTLLRVLGGQEDSARQSEKECLDE